MLQSYLSAFQNGLICLLIQIIAEVMVQNVSRIDAIFDQIRLKFKQNLAHFLTLKPKIFNINDPK